MRPISDILVAILISFVFHSMTSAVALPSLDTPGTSNIKQTVDTSYYPANHLEAREKCPRNDHGDRACGTCVTLYEGSFFTGKSHISCTSPHQCLTAKSMGLVEFRSVDFKGSTNCRFSRHLKCEDNALGDSVREDMQVRTDLQDSEHKRGFLAVECVRPD